MTELRTGVALILSAAALLLSACSRGAEAPDETNSARAEPAPTAAASAPLIGGDGAKPGNVAMSEDANGVTLKIDAEGLPAGLHGVHLHEKGVCEGPKFESAGAHLNPAGKQHGRDNPEGSHLGDLANFLVAASGSGSTSLMVAGVSVAGANALGDADGTSLVIHAKPDDYKTDPSGASGDRIACAVIAAPR